jgi:small subunit ribosomal protein S16
MPVKIRLSRQGRKAKPIYHIVVADSRAPRDGRFITRLGIYNPNTNPATIDLDFDKTLDWLVKGAQPTDTCRSILSKRGVLMKKHLLDGVRKGAFSEDEANIRFDAWSKDKEQKLQGEISQISTEKEKAEKEKMEREAKISEERAAELAKKKIAAETHAKTEEAVAEEQPSEETSTEVIAEEAVTEEPSAEVIADVVTPEETPSEDKQAETEA